MNAEVPPMPADFGFRYLLWLAWTSKVTLILTIQQILLLATLPDPSNPGPARPWLHWVLFAANCAGIIGAQLARSANPPVFTPPTKAP